MRSTVFNREILKGLIKYISENLKLTDLDGVEHDIPVRVRKADEDFKIEDYPMVTIQLMNISKRDEVRYQPNGEPIFDMYRKVSVIKKGAVPHTLTYQIDIWCTLQSDLDNLSMMWNYNIGRTFNLPVVDNGGVERTAMCLQKQSVERRNDRLTGSNRIFSVSLTYDIWGEIDEDATLEEIPLVQEVIINAEEKKIPKTSNFITKRDGDFILNNADRDNYRVLKGED